jgi:hypothetical protein
LVIKYKGIKMATILDGFIQGTDYNNGKWGIKVLGTKEAGAILFQISVSGKDKDGNKQYASIDGKVNIKSESEADRVYKLIADNKLCQFEGFFTPNNYTNKEGKEIRKVQFLVFDSTTFVEKQLEGKTQGKSEPKTEDVW